MANGSNPERMLSIKRVCGWPPQPLMALASAKATSRGGSWPVVAFLSSGEIYENSLGSGASGLLLTAFFRLDRGMVLPSDVGEVDGGRREGELELLHRVRHDLRHRKIAKPLVVRRDHVPRCLAGARGVHRVLERLDVVVPQRPLR